MPTGRCYAACGAINNPSDGTSKIYVIGGTSISDELTTNEEYDPGANSWTTKTSMPMARCIIRAGVVNNKIYIVGGVNDGVSFDTNEEYDPSLDR